MKTLQIELTLYNFEELSETAKQIAIYEHGIFLNQFPQECQNEKGEMYREYIDHTEAEIIESITINEYLFFQTGNLASVTTYTGKHEKAGISELTLEGKIYTL